MRLYGGGMYPARLLIVALLLLVSCARSGNSVSVGGLLSDRDAMNGQIVRTHGTLSVEHGMANLYSADRAECVGLLTHNVSAADLSALSGRSVRAEGRLMAEGCAASGSCSKHLCGPAILYNVRVERQ